MTQQISAQSVGLICGHHLPSRCLDASTVRPRHLRKQTLRSTVTAAVVEEATERGSVGGNGQSALNKGIAGFYDKSSALWERMWGEHMHHGYYPKGSQRKSNQQAQVDMIEEILKWAGVTNASKVLDVGCGIGGSSRHLARKYGCAATGITLSPVQAARGNALAKQQGLGDRVSFQVADALLQPFADASFDLIWSLESGEHMPDKARFVGELARVCAPGGRVIIVTWCHRNLLEGEAALAENEERLLDQICQSYYLPRWCSLDDYRAIFEQEGLQDIKTADWSEEVAPFWDAVMLSALSWQGLSGLFTAGWKTIKGAVVMPLMKRGFSMGLIKFVLITARKPE